MSFNMSEFFKEWNIKKAYIESHLNEYLRYTGKHPPLIHEAMHYAVINGGKRLRPIMLLEAARLAGGKEDEVIPTACAIEMIHCYSLVHDDLPAMDNDELRRGKPTCHIIYGEDIAILAGDALLTYAFELISQNISKDAIKPDRVVRVIEEIASAAGSRGMIGGQVIDLQSEGKEIHFEDLKTMHSLKTGALFRASLRAGALLSGMEAEGLEAMNKYAYHFGLAFQITDDILDINGEQDAIGKPVGSDSRNRKTTYPGLMGIEKAHKLASEHVEKCLESLARFNSKADFLRNLAYFTLYRKG